MKNLEKFGFVLNVDTLKNPTFALSFTHLRSFSNSLYDYLLKNDYTEDEISKIHYYSLKLVRRLQAGYKDFKHYYLACKIKLPFYEYHIACFSYEDVNC